MRGEDRCVAAGASGGGGGGGQSGRGLTVQSYSSTTTFGWVFPRTKTRRKSVIDAVWLREFGRDIEILQSEIRRQTAFVYGDEKQSHKEDSLRTDCGSECCDAAMSCEDRVSTPEVTDSSRVSLNSPIFTRSLDSRGVICAGLDNSKSDLGVDLPAKVKVQESTPNGESSASEKAFVLDSTFNTYTASGKCDEYSSMQSDISRDSGVFSTDGASIVSEGQGDKSLLHEIGDVLGDQDLSIEPCIHCGSLPLEDTILGSKESASRPLWMTRFSSSKDLLAEWGSHEWELGHSPLSCISPVSTRKTYASEDSDSHVTPSTILSDEEEGLKVKQCIACEKINNESPLSHPPLPEISELAKYTRSFQGLSNRIEDLRSGLESLAGEANETKRDFVNLEERTAQLLASTVTYRHRLTKVRALQLLEDRLQEEWWAAYDPSSVSFHENYIV